MMARNTLNWATRLRFQTLGYRLRSTVLVRSALLALLGVGMYASHFVGGLASCGGALCCPYRGRRLSGDWPFAGHAAAGVGNSFLATFRRKIDVSECAVNRFDLPLADRPAPCGAYILNIGLDRVQSFFLLRPGQTSP